MTDEQIKQNAEEYADKAAPITEQNKGIPLAIHTAAEVAYIAGAHSRDEEIERLQNQIEELSDQLKMNAENIQKLRHPWISVDERLPEEGSDNISIPVAAITNKGYWFKGQYDFNNKDWFFSEDPDHLDFEVDEFVTHWMPILKSQKGENNEKL